MSIEFELIQKRKIAFSEIDLIMPQQVSERIAIQFHLAPELDYTTEKYYPMMTVLLPDYVSYMVMPKTFYTVIAFDIVIMDTGNDLTKSHGRTLGEALCRAILKLYYYQHQHALKLKQQTSERKKESSGAWIQKLLPKQLLRP